MLSSLSTITTVYTAVSLTMMLTLFGVVFWLLRQATRNGSELDEFTDMFAKQAARLDHLELTISAQAVQIAHLQTVIRERDEQIAALKMSRDATIARLEAKLVEIEKLRNEINELANKYARGKRGF